MSAETAVNLPRRQRAATMSAGPAEFVAAVNQQTHYERHRSPASG
jgi:hypothetical protein